MPAKAYSVCVYFKAHKKITKTFVRSRRRVFWYIIICLRIPTISYQDRTHVDTQVILKSSRCYKTLMMPLCDSKKRYDIFCMRLS